MAIFNNLNYCFKLRSLIIYDLIFQGVRDTYDTYERPKTSNSGEMSKTTVVVIIGRNLNRQLLQSSLIEILSWHF